MKDYVTNSLLCKQDLFFYFLLSLFFFILLIVSPLALLYGVILLFIVVNIKSLIVRGMCELYISFAVAFITASIKINYGPGDDFYNVYVPVFESIRNGVSIFSFFSGGVEFGLPLFFYFISVFFPNITNIELNWIVTFCLSLFFFVWVERFFLKGIEPKYRCIALASILMFFNYMILSHLMRQALATIFILYSIGFFIEKSYKKTFIFFIFACLCHLTSVIIAPIFFVFLSNKSFYKNLLLIVIFLSSVGFNLVVSFVLSSGLLSVATYKFEFYDQNTIETTAGAGFIFHFLVLFIFTFFINDNIDRPYKSLIRYSCPAYLSLVVIPFASDRLFMPITAFMLGGLFFICLKNKLLYFKIALIAYCVLRFLRLGIFSDNIYLLWSNYPWLGPFF